MKCYGCQALRAGCPSATERCGHGDAGQLLGVGSGLSQLVQVAVGFGFDISF